ncbi:MAG: DUF6273 domain-containing protein [bacterium]|nr:DUF6273 domain-containing protein [bacterium]
MSDKKKRKKRSKFRDIIISFLIVFAIYAILGAIYWSQCQNLRPGVRLPVPTFSPYKAPEKTGNNSDKNSEHKSGIIKKIPPVPAPPACVAFSEAKVGSFVAFGKYPQEHGDTPEPVAWHVLDKQGETLLLLSHDCLDCYPYNAEEKDVTWEKCDLRRWLNEEFLQKAFSAQEQAQIVISEIRGNDNDETRQRDDAVTRDKIFCLSLKEAHQYFADASQQELASARATSYALDKGAYYFPSFNWYGGHTWYWLRSPGNDLKMTACVNQVGHVEATGRSVASTDNSVRPALRVKY